MSVRAVLALAESVKLPVAKVMAPVVALAVRFGFVVLLAELNVARSVAAVPGVTVPFQFPPVFQDVLLPFDVHVAFCPKAETPEKPETAARIPDRKRR